MKILITGPSWVGDMAMAHALCRHLRQQYPDCLIDILAQAWCLAVTERMPEVRRSIVSPLKHGELGLLKRYRLGKSLRAEAYDWAIVLPITFKSALVSYWAKIRRRTGWHGECRYGVLNDRRPLDPNVLPLMVQRFVALGYDEQSDWSPDQILPPKLVAQADAIPDIVDHYALKIAPERPVLAICPGAAYGSAKRWPVEHVATLARQKLAEGWQVWLLGSPAEADLLQTINQQAEQGCQILGGQVSLAHKIDLLSLASVVVSNDSGLLHVAAGLQKPVIAIYGSTTPDFTPPLSLHTRILQTEHTCRPCFKRECPLPEAKLPEAQLQCLRDIQPTQVAAAIDQLVTVA